MLMALDYFIYSIGWRDGLFGYKLDSLEQINFCTIKFPHFPKHPQIFREMINNFICLR